MSPNPASADPDEQRRHTVNALAKLLVWTTPWLLEIGSWIFGGLVTFNLLFISVILNLRPVDILIRISLTAFAIAVPLNVTGLFLLRLVKDMQNIQLDELSIQAFEEAEFPDLDAHLPPADERQQQNEKRTRVSMACAFAIAALTTVLSLTGFVAALSHVAWWIGVVFGAAVALCAALVIWIAA